MVRCEHVVKSYKKTRVIDDITFSVNNGEVLHS
jgi:ABC-type multidrug transport system ATPase subunit